MTVRYHYFHQVALTLPDDLELPLAIPAGDGPARLSLARVENTGRGVLPGIPFHTQYDGFVEVSFAQRAHARFAIASDHTFADGTNFVTRRSEIARETAGEIDSVGLSPFGSVSVVSAREYTDDEGTTLDVTPERAREAVTIEVFLEIAGYGFTEATADTRRDVTIDSLTLPTRAAVSWWQLRATLDPPPVAPPVPVSGESVADPGGGASGALLRLQHALVQRFAAYCAGDGIQEAFDRYCLNVDMAAMPAPMLYDEPPAGLGSFFRIGNASVDVETRSGNLLWSISQEIEAHIDPVRGRAAALAMGDVIERAFRPAVPTLAGHGVPGLRVEPWLEQAALAIPADPNRPSSEASLAPVRVVDFVQTDSRIGYSEAGLTYQVVVTFDIVMEPLNG